MENTIIKNIMIIDSMNGVICLGFNPTTFAPAVALWRRFLKATNWLTIIKVLMYFQSIACMQGTVTTTSDLDIQVVDDEYTKTKRATTTKESIKHHSNFYQKV